MERRSGRAADKGYDDTKLLRRLQDEHASRLEISFGFESHFIRGLAKMRLRVDMALIVMLAMALGRIKDRQKEKMRSLVQAA